MKEKIKKNISLIIKIFIILQPILDFTTGICLHTFHLNITIGMIVRVLFLVWMMYLTVFIYQKKTILKYYGVVFLYSILYLVGVIIYQDKTLIFQEVQGLIRVFYFPLLLLSFYMLKEEIKVEKKTVQTTLVLYLVLIFIPLLLGIGNKSYEITKAGTLGFFNSANEISGIISILTPLLLLEWIEQKHIIKKGILILICLTVILTIGTKTPLLSLGITTLAIFLFLIIKWIRQKKYQPIIILMMILIGCSTILVIVIPTTNFYKNIKTHLDFLGVENIAEVFQEKELIDHFIFSQRLTFWEDKKEIYGKAPIYQKLVGIGYHENKEEIKMIEMDYIDIYYSHGILGFILFFACYFVILFKVLKKKSPMTIEKYSYLISIFLILILSFFTGHIITAPAVSIFVVVIILLLENQKNKKEKIIT